MYYGLKKCEQYKASCLMNVDGKCVGLNNTRFEYACPFYKNQREMSTAEIETYDDGCMNGFKQKEPEHDIRRMAEWSK